MTIAASLLVICKLLLFTERVLFCEYTLTK
jgi:hypothetical protein